MINRASRSTIDRDALLITAIRHSCLKIQIDQAHIRRMMPALATACHLLAFVVFSCHDGFFVRNADFAHR